MSIKPSNCYSIEKWKAYIEANDCEKDIDICLKTTCYNYYNNNLIIDPLLQKYKDNKEITNKILLYIINNIPCYNLNKYIKLYNKTNDTKFKSNKQLSALVTSLWTYEAHVNKKNYNTFEDSKLKLIKTKSLNKWLDYVNYLIENSRNINHLYIINTFERFLQITPSYLKVWLMYIDFIKRIKKDSPKDVFIYYHRLNSVKSINTIYKTMDSSLKIYIKMFYLKEIEEWYKKLMDKDNICKDVDVISGLFKVIRNLKVNNDSLTVREKEFILTVYFKALYKHLSIKYPERFMNIIGTLLSDYEFKSESNPNIVKYMISKNLNNHFKGSTAESSKVFSKFMVDILLSNKQTDSIDKKSFKSYLGPFIHSQLPGTRTNPTLNHKKLMKIIKQYGTVDDYKSAIIHSKKLKQKKGKLSKRHKLKGKRLIKYTPERKFAV